MNTKEIKLPPMPEWAKMDNLGGLVPSEIRSALNEFGREAVRLNAQSVPDEPDWRHPKIQGLIGSEARLRITIDLIWRILEDPNQEFGPSDMEYWDTTHDRLKEALSTKPAAPEIPTALDGVVSSTELGAVLTYTTSGHSRPCGQIMGANGAGDFALLIYGKPNEAEAAARLHIRELESAGYRIKAATLVTNEECYSGPQIRTLQAPNAKMSLCPECGGKRCPRAKHHDNACAQHQEQPQQERKPLTDEQIMSVVRSPDYDLEEIPDSWAFTLGVRFAERHHGITED